jgi:hypothetical protein
MAFANLFMPPEEIDLRLNFLKQFAFNIFCKGKTSLSKVDFQKFLKKYSDDFDIYLSETFVASLTNAKILSWDNERIYFKYRYYYFFFVAQYLSLNINYISDDIKGNIEKLISSMHKESSSAILIFLVSFSKDPFIIDGLRLYAQKLFCNTPPAKLESDTAFFNDFCSELLDIILPDVEPSIARKRQNEIMDFIHEETDNRYSGSDDSFSIDSDNETVDDINFINTLISSIRCIETIGQILKTHYGSLQRPQKDALFFEGVNIAMRALGDFYETMRKDNQVLIEQIENAIKESKYEDKSSIEQLTRKIVMHFSIVISMIFFNITANSFGNKNLLRTCDNFFNREDTSNAEKLIALAIELYSSHKINFEKVKELVKTLKNDSMAFYILKVLVAEHLYMYPPHPFSHRQKIANLLGISIQKIPLVTRSSAKQTS